MAKKDLDDDKGDKLDDIFGTRLIHLIIDRKVKKSELAKAVGISRETLRIYSCGKTYKGENHVQILPSIKVLRKVAQFFNVSADYLIGLSNTPHRLGGDK